MVLHKVALTVGMRLRSLAVLCGSPVCGVFRDPVCSAPLSVEPRGPLDVPWPLPGWQQPVAALGAVPLELTFSRETVFLEPFLPLPQALWVPPPWVMSWLETYMQKEPSLGLKHQ